MNMLLEKMCKICVKNHSVSAGKIDVDRMLRIFQFSEIKHKTQCVNYIGDEKNKTFPELKKNNT